MDEKQIKELRTLFVKLSAIFGSNKFFILNTNICFERTKFCFLESKYTDLLCEYYGNQKLILINNAKKIKEELDQHYEYITDEKTIKFYKEMIQSCIGVYMNKDWKNFLEDYPESENVLFEDSLIYKMKLGVDHGLLLAKEFLPTITKKTLKNVFYHVQYNEELSLYIVLFKYQHSHFMVYRRFPVIPMRF